MKKDVFRKTKKIIFLMLTPIILCFYVQVFGQGSASYDEQSRISNPLVLLSDKTPVIEARGGAATIAEATNTFTSYIDPNFKKWDLDKSSLATKEISVKIYWVGDSFFSPTNALMYLNKNLDKLCLTQSQIIYFCKRYPSKMIDERYGKKGTFFLFKAREKYFLAKVNKDADGLNISVFRLNSFGACAFDYLFVVPIN